MDFVQKRWKAFVAGAAVWVSWAWSYYQANQTLPTKQIFLGLLAGVLGFIVTHQVPNKK